MIGMGGEFGITSLTVSLPDAKGVVVDMHRVNWEIILQIKYCCKDIPKIGCNGK